MKPVIRKVKWRKPSMGLPLSWAGEEDPLFSALNNTACCIVPAWKGRGGAAEAALSRGARWGWALSRGGGVPGTFWGFTLFYFHLLLFFLSWQLMQNRFLEKSLRRAILGGNQLSCLKNAAPSECIVPLFKPLLKTRSSGLGLILLFKDKVTNLKDIKVNLLNQEWRKPFSIWNWPKWLWHLKRGKKDNSNKDNNNIKYSALNRYEWPFSHSALLALIFE